MDDNYKYDIAFSFLKEDQELIEMLYTLLKDKVNCFVYFNEQERLAGRDGENVFNDVFAKEARMVVVAYNDQWGKTNWTRVEETAIRNRGHDEGYDFVTLMPVKSGLTPPKWLPKNRIWLGLKTYGLEKAAVVLESRVQELFGEVKILSTEDKIVREAELINQREEYRNKINSPEGIQIASQEFENFKSILNDKVLALQNKLNNWHWKIIDNNYKGQNIMSYNHSLMFKWEQQYRNTGENTGIWISIWNGYFNARLSETDPFWEYQKLALKKYYIGINDFGNNIWKDSENENATFTSEELADKFLIEFFEESKKHKR